MDSNRFMELWGKGRERIFPDWTDDIRELKREAASGRKTNVEVILDRMDGKDFFSLFDYEGGNIAEDLGGSGRIAVMSPEALIRRYERQMRISQPVFRLYRIAASVSDVLGMEHPEITSVPDSYFSYESRNGLIDTKRKMVFFKKDTLESAVTYFSLFCMIRKMWQNKTSLKKIPAGTDPAEDMAAFAMLMMDVLFQIDYPLDVLTDDELTRERIRRRASELAEELY